MNLRQIQEVFILNIGYTSSKKGKEILDKRRKK